MLGVNIYQLLATIFMLNLLVYLEPASIHEESEIEVLTQTVIYEESSLEATVIGKLEPQKIKVLSRTNNFYQVKTPEGDYWIRPQKVIDEHGIKRMYLHENYYLYHGPKASYKMTSQLSPQYVQVINEDGDWVKIKTWLGEKYINTNEDALHHTIQVLTRTSFYEKADKQSIKVNEISPQEVQVLNKTKRYFKINTWLGDYWIQPKKYIDEHGVTKYYVDKKQYLYNAKDVNTKTQHSVAPQYVTLVDETDDWLRIKTWLGEKYIYKHEQMNSSKGKIAYLTIDDGPNQYTERILNILKKYQAKATFFMLEPNMRSYKQLVKRMVNEGHFTALHSVTHNQYKLYHGSAYSPVWEMEAARKTLKNITGENHYLVRVPYGSAPFMTRPFRNALVEYNYKMWDWTIDSQDWKYSNAEYYHIVNNVKKGLISVERRGEDVVILLHDRSQTVKALPYIIEYLQNKGYQLEAYSEDEHIPVNFWDDKRL
ncbi:polysaccharide deacetylase [Filobacillus milosensis]|uniref:Polysaccharide deacetylase n=1 Tax=Filobacillus milosensis TaxID=94137 RepID=A0A4Y8IHT6_9BACI|nr:polysaccharide deacetylase family protein [Filobacillus milosensis]TFB14263.1 polysaccharide deacetylase [Filobacillus milosensis]